MKKLLEALGLLLATMILTSSSPASEQRRMNFRAITMEDGLPTNCVRSVTQDRFGFIWFGTDNGLCRFDGYGVQVFRNPLAGFDQYVSMLATLDEGILVGSTSGAYLFDFQTEQFRLLDQKITGTVTQFAKDADSDVWVSTLGGGVYCYNLHSKSVKHYAFQAIGGRVASIFADTNNQIWALANNSEGGIYRLNKAKNAFEAFHAKAERPLNGMSMLQDHRGQLLIGTWDDGLVRLHSDGTVETMLNPRLAGIGLHIHALALKSKTELLIGCEEGLVSYDLQQNTWCLLTSAQSDTPVTHDRFVYGITCDNEGGVWMGTFYNGVRYISPMEERFSVFNGTNGLHGNVVGRFAEDDNHRIWVATDDGGLNCLDAQTHRFLPFPGQSTMQSYNVHGLLSEGDDLWVGTYGNGIIRLDTRTGAQTVYQLSDSNFGSSCYAFFRDSQQRLWAASMDGVSLFDAPSNRFKAVKSFKMLTIDIDEDTNGNVWFATQGGGLWRFGNGKWKQYQTIDGDTTSLPSVQVNCLRRHDNGALYVATSNGLCYYQPETDNFRRIAIDCDSQDFSSIFFNQDELWLASSRGIIRYIPGERLQVFNRHDGLLSSQTPANAGLMASDGCLYFGTAKGFHAFYPYQIKVNQTPPPVFITSVDLFNQNVEVGSKRLPEAIHQVKQLNLYYGDNMFTISFAALSYISPEKNQYAYRLEGFDKDWNYIGNEHKATYTNIPAGTYTFLVKATNNDGVWSSQEARLKIVVHPPFWWSLPAKIFYLILIGLLIYLYTQMRLRKEKRRHQRELRKLEEKKEQEIRDARLSFFTMIAHEIRTPVTLIIGPLETLKAEWERVAGNVKDGSAMTHTLDVIDRNAQRLLNLVNQLLDFNKVQQRAIQMHFKLNNISRMMHAVAERFEPTLQQNGARFVVDYPDENFSAVIDNEAITKVISNLMTNATKYTKDYVHLSCHVLEAERAFRIEVEDNGIGISPDEQGKIFNPFYQARDNKPGTGIGLNIVKNLVTAHHGQVEVRSQPGAGSTFLVTLPIMQPDAEVDASEENRLPVSDAAETVAGETAKATTESENRPAMLIVEDDADMRNFIVAHFKESYYVLTAENGVEGLRQLQQNSVTLIVSDWMMPEMDGAEFCRRVRNDQATSHIPFIMLTAKTDNDSKTEGMNCGADAYIEKPFSMKYLEACIRNLIEMRRLLQSKFSHTPLEPITEIAPTPVDNEFLTKMNQFIEENLNNADLNVAFLAEQMGVSRSSLFAKIKGLVDVTPNEMIQLVRLKKAAQLLQEQKYRVNEVAYMVGFSSPSYFSKCFSKQFGVKPAEFGGEPDEK